MKLKQAERIRAAGRRAMVTYAIMLAIMVASMVSAYAGVFDTMDTQVKSMLGMMLLNDVAAIGLFPAGV